MGPLVMLEHVEAVAARHLPQAGGHVQAAGEERLAVGAKGHGKDAALVAERLGIDRLSRCRLPKLDFSSQRMLDRVAGSGYEACAVGAKGHGQDGQAMRKCRTPA